MSKVDQDVITIMKAAWIIEDTDLWHRDEQVEILLKLYRLRTYMRTKEAIKNES
jgi:hypothetical protein